MVAENADDVASVIASSKRNAGGSAKLEFERAERLLRDQNQFAALGRLSK